MRLDSILVVAVNYHSGKDSLRLARSLALCNGSSVATELLVVDNTPESTDRDFDRDLDHAFSRAFYCPSPKNLGYLGGAAYGLREYLQSHELPDWVIVTNVDLEFTPHFLEALRAAGHGIRGILAPRIVSTTSGDDANPYLVTKPSRGSIKRLQWVFRSPLFTNGYIVLSKVRRVLNRYLQWSHDITQVQRKIYSPHGSCMVFPAAYFQAGGTLDYPGFLFGEEFFVAESAKRLGIDVHYIPEMHVIHREHATTGRLRSRAMVRHMQKSVDLILANYYS